MSSPTAPPPPTRWASWDGGASLNYGSRVGFAAGAAVGIILLICVLILVCDRRRRPYIGNSSPQLPLGTRHLYATQPVDSGPKQVQYPVVVVNPDNEVECGRKVLLDRTPSAKQNPANYFTSIGPGPPLFAATIPQCQWAAPGALPSSSLQTPSGSLFQSFRQRFRSTDATQPAGGASGSNEPGILPLHTSDGVMPGGMPGSSNEPTLARASLRSPFADWNPATGLANDTNHRPGSLELASARSGTGQLAASDNIV
ncbi:hypothetical protein ABBQ38_004980 [Trebouxia sp. C0009 RCD-2024]